MHATLGKLKRYHAAVGLNMSLYHQDPFWWSHAADVKVILTPPCIFH